MEKSKVEEKSNTQEYDAKEQSRLAKEAAQRECEADLAAQKQS